MSQPTVVLVANDVVPGLGLPVAAPGIRAFGLAAGLRHHGCRVATVVDGGPLRSLCPDGRFPVLPEGTVVREGNAIGEYVAAQAPAVVVLTNTNQFDRLRPAPGLHLVIDLFAPKMLELACNPGREDQARALEVVRERKLRALAAADGFIVNGAKKVPYFLGWLLAAGRDPAGLPLEVVPLGVPAHRAPPGGEGPGLRLVVAGYRHGWNRPGPWLEQLAARLNPPHTTLDLLMPPHWGRRRPGDQEDEAALAAVARLPGVTRHEALPYESFLDLLGRCDLAVDLFPRTLEREYAVVTRTMVALSCGVPVVHPPFTEVSPLIARYEAGWLVEADDAGERDAVLDEVLRDPAALAARAAGARRLWAEVLDPAVSVAPLARMARDLLAG